MDHYEYTELLKTLDIKMQNVTGVVRPNDIKARLDEISELENSDGFWNDAAAAGTVQKEKTQAERRLAKYSKTFNLLQDAHDLYEMAKEEGDDRFDDGSTGNHGAARRHTRTFAPVLPWPCTMTCLPEHLSHLSIHEASCMCTRVWVCAGLCEGREATSLEHTASTRHIPEHTDKIHKNTPHTSNTDTFLSMPRPPIPRHF